MLLKGFTIYLKRKDIFIVTDRQKKTRKFATEVIERLNDGYFTIECTDANIDYILYNMLKANCEIKGQNDKKYYDIYGDNFGGHGDFVNTNNTIIIHI